MNLQLVWSCFVWLCLTIQTKWWVLKILLLTLLCFLNDFYLCTLDFDWFLMLLTLHLFCRHFDSHTRKWTCLLFCKKFRLNHMPLHFQMVINENLSENNMNTCDGILYNFIIATSQVMTTMVTYLGVTHRKKFPLFFQAVINALSRPEGIVANLTASIGKINLVLF